MKRKHINNRFKYARLYAGYTQVEAAKASGFMTKQALSHYEKGTRTPSNKVLYTLTKLYNVSLHFLLKQDFYINHDEYVESILLLDKKSIQILKSLKQHNIALVDLKKYLNTIKKGNSK